MTSFMNSKYRKDNMKQNENEVVEIYSKKDAVFKSIFGTEEGKYFLETLLKAILKKDVKIEKYKDRELPVINIAEKIKIIDLQVKVDDELIHIEVNSQSNSYIRFRNFIFFAKVMVSDQNSGYDYKSKQKYVSINLSSKLGKNHDLIEEYQLKNDKGDLFVPNVKIYEVNLDLAKELCYNGEASEDIKHIAALAMTRTELEKYKGGDEFMGKLAKKLSDINADDAWFATPEDEYLGFIKFEREEAKEEGKEEGLAEGLAEGKIQIAKKLLKEGVPYEIVSKCSELSIKELKQLEKSDANEN